MIRAARVVAFLLALLLASALVFLTWVYQTESGLKWALGYVDDYVSFQRLDGKASNLNIQGLEIELPTVGIKVDRLSIRWSLIDLLSSAVRVKKLDAGQVRVIPKTNQSSASEYAGWAGVTLPFNLHLEQMRVSQLQMLEPGSGQVTTSLNDIQLSANVTNNTLRLKGVAGIENKIQASVSGRMDLSVKKIINKQNTINLNYQLFDTDKSDGQIAAGKLVGNWHQAMLQHQQFAWADGLRVVDIEQPPALLLEVSIDGLAKPKLEWQGNIQLPKQATLKVEDHVIEVSPFRLTTKGEYNLNADLAGLLMQLNGRLDVMSPEFGKLDMTLDWAIEDLGLNINQLKVRQSQASELAKETADANQFKSDPPKTFISAVSSGELTVQGSVNSLLNLQHESPLNIDLAGEWADLMWSSGEANATVLSNGQFTVRGDEVLHFFVNSSGTVAEAPYQLRLQGNRSGRAVNIQALTAEVLENSFTARGRFAQDYDVLMALEAPKLAQVWPGLEGQISSQVRITGLASNPTVNGELSGKQLRLNDVTLSSLNATLNGALNEHLFQLELAAKPDVQLSLAGRGLWQKAAQYHFSLNKLNLSLDATDAYQLQSPATFTVNKSEIDLSEMCLNKQDEKMCIMFRQNDDKSSANLLLENIALNPINRWMPLHGYNMSGLVTGELSYMQRESWPTMKGDFELTNLRVGVVDAKTEPAAPTTNSQSVFELSSLHLNLDQSDRLTVKLEGVSPGKDELQGELRIAGKLGTASLSQAPLEGELTVDFDSLRYLPLPAPMFKDATGRLSVDLSVQGTINDPRLSARGELMNGTVALPQFGVVLRELNVSTHSQVGRVLNVQGSAKSGNGEIDVNGTVSFSDLENPSVDFLIVGDKVQVLNTKYQQADASVDLKLKYQSRLVSLIGKVDVNSANINYHIPEGVVRVSPDVVLLGAESDEAELKQRMNLKVDFGKDTRIRVQGLEADVVGDLLLLKAADGPTRASGRIDLENGKYAAYGQELILDQGELIFAGNTISNPNLDIRAEKKAGKYTAGVSVSGTGSNPILNLYSSPTLGDQDILSLLVFDKPVDELGVQDTLTLLRIANSLRGQKDEEGMVERLTNDVQQSLGLTELGLDYSDNGPVVKAGKQLSSGLYVGYGYGLLDAAQSLIIKYKINDAWSIQGDLGNKSGADIKYQIDR